MPNVIYHLLINVKQMKIMKLRKLRSNLIDGLD